MLRKLRLRPKNSFLIKNVYSDDYSETSGSLWQYYRDEPDDHPTDSEPSKSKIKITGNTPNDGNKKN